MNTLTHSALSEPTVAGSTKLLFSIEEAGKALGLGRTMIYQQINSGRLKSVHVGKAHRITWTSLQDFVNQL